MTVPEIKTDLRRRLSNVGDYVGQQMHETFEDFIHIFYGEYIPKLYGRTGTLAGSLASPAVSGGYPSIDIEDHFNEVGYANAGIPSAAIVAMNLVGGTHGGYAGGTAIFWEGHAIIASQYRAWVIAAFG